MANRTKFTNRAKEKFLEVVRETANVSEAARLCGVSRRCAYDHRDADPEFRQSWDDAVEEAVDGLEREAWRRGVEGVDKPVTFQGVITDTYREYSDRMLELLLKSHRPEKYRERHSLEHSGPGGGPIQTEDVSELSDAELLDRASQLGGRIARLVPVKANGAKRNGKGAAK